MRGWSRASRRACSSIRARRLTPEELSAAQVGRDRFGGSEADPADDTDGEEVSGTDDDATASDAADADDQEPVREAA